MKAVEEEERPSAHAQLAKESGFTGLSILHRLSKLYEFDILNDMVYDAMHNITLNVVSQHLHHYAEQGFLKGEVEHRLKSVPWTAGLWQL